MNIEEQTEKDQTHNKDNNKELPKKNRVISIKKN